MRVALLASTFALLVGSPAFAQCVYVACGGSVPNPPSYQQPVYQAPMAAARPPQNNVGSDYDAGYAAGLAARPANRVVATSSNRTHAKARSTTSGRHVAKATTSRGHAATSQRRQVARVAPRPAVRHAVRTAPRPAVHHVARTAPRITHTSRRVTTSYSHSGYQDPIKNRAVTYGAINYGSSTSMASLMSRTTWVGPSTITSQNGQTCGWGARIVVNEHGYAQRQAMWVCQCPQGWRPPGY